MISEETQKGIGIVVLVLMMITITVQNAELQSKKVDWITKPDVTIVHSDRVCYGWTETYHHQDYTKLRCRRK